MLRKIAFAAALASSAALGTEPVTAPSTTGQTGLLNMPVGRIAPEGTWCTGFSFTRPYSAVWSSIALFPWLEGSFHYTRIMHVPGFNPAPGIDYGDHEDKSFDLNLRLLPERVRSWQFTPGTSSIYPIHHGPSCFITAVKFWFMPAPPGFVPPWARY
jgi:hypothetical protein